MRWTVAQFGIQVLKLTAQELVVELDSPWACYWTWLPVSPLLHPAGVFLEFAQTFVAKWRLRVAHRGGLSEGHSLIPSLTLGPRSSYRTLQDRDVLCLVCCDNSSPLRYILATYIIFLPYVSSSLKFELAFGGNCTTGVLQSVHGWLTTRRT